jgi:type II secretory pathway pseudopilin PulG
MRRSLGVLVLVVSCAVFAIALTLGLLIALPEREIVPAVAAIVFGAIAVAGLVWAARLLQWPRRTFTGVAVALIVALSGVATYEGMRLPSGSKQKRTMANIRAVAMAAEAYATDHNRYPTSRSVRELSRILDPTYSKELPRRDAWRHDLRYELIEVGDGSQFYFVASPGKDGLWQRTQLTEYAPGGTTSFDADIIFSNGVFVQYPEGAQMP